MTVEDPYLSMLLAIAGGLALFLIGLRFLSEALQQLGENLIFKAIGGMHSTYSSVSSGIISSFFIQSRLSTSLMASSYATSGVFSLSQLIGFILGANLGSTFVLWLFVLNWKMATLFFLVMGVFLKIYSSRERLATFGHLLFALGLLMLGQWLIQILIPMSTLLTFSLKINGSWTQFWPILGIFFALTIVVRSSVAMVALIMVLVMTGLIGEKLALLSVVAVQIGSVVPALTESWSVSWRARLGQSYLLIAHTIMGLITLVFFDTLYSVLKTIVFAVENSQMLSWSFLRKDVFFLPAFVLIYNGILACLFAVLIGPVRKLFLDRLEKSRPKESQKLKLIGQSLQVSPVLGLNLASQETMKLAAMIESLLMMTKEVIFDHASASVTQRIVKYEQITDNIKSEVSLFITKLLEVNLSSSQGHKLKALSRMVHDLESIADHCKSIVCNLEEANKKGEKNDLSSFKKIQSYFENVLSYYEMVFAEFTSISHGISGKVDLGLMKEHSQLLEEQYLKTMKDLETKAENGPTLFCRELLISLNQIQTHTFSISEAFH
ncbi:MAG: Na/Pi cotransporter family protein [Bdellovibrionales bacterium]|nr:Na/Pi cotransporter family protein [Bdellovibrionales bacterium]